MQAASSYFQHNYHKTRSFFSHAMFETAGILRITAQINRLFF